MREWLRWNWPQLAAGFIVAGCALWLGWFALHELGQPHWSGGPGW